MRPPSAFVFSYNSNNVIDSIGQPPERQRKMQCLPRSCAVTKLARDFEGNIKPRQRHGGYGVKNYAKKTDERPSRRRLLDYKCDGYG